MKLPRCQCNYLKYPLAVEDAPSVSHCFFKVAIYLQSHGLFQPQNCKTTGEAEASRKQTWLAPVVVPAGAEAAVAMVVVAMVLG